MFTEFGVPQCGLAHLQQECLAPGTLTPDLHVVSHGAMLPAPERSVGSTAHFCNSLERDLVSRRHYACYVQCRKMSTLASPKLPLRAPTGDSRSTRSAGPGQSPPRRLFARRYINIVINLTLLVLVLVSFVTGWVASLLGLTEFGLHKYSSIALLLMASAHLALHWRSLTQQLRNLGTSRYDRRNPAQIDRRGSGLRAGISPTSQPSSPMAVDQATASPP